MRLLNFHRLFIFVCNFFVDSANLENLLPLKISQFMVYVLVVWYVIFDILSIAIIAHQIYHKNI